ncbi:hypothetical protein FOMPIDRAFT_160399 [Fomitopsis schrenkii]|uniref:Uncharacterized protein n=1 Tax=Fomitopsis schrenkii TaxID=2126942 RepID=S8EGH1_FOMSC|nr:hypothetical protein FOMPIDRAFT_160399 [Fomitopsis schrenkii]
MPLPTSLHLSSLCLPTHRHDRALFSARLTHSLRLPACRCTPVRMHIVHDRHALRQAQHFRVASHTTASRCGSGSGRL